MEAEQACVGCQDSWVFPCVMTEFQCEGVSKERLVGALLSELLCIWCQDFRGSTGIYGFGSIPACAGEPMPIARAWRQALVYPRVCGGTVVIGQRGRRDRGLSPRVRGNLVGRRKYTPAERSIPACAGEPAGEYGFKNAGLVYPRVCGGTMWPQSTHRSIRGLSPRVRGNRRGWRGRCRSIRSIPACAGEPVSLRTKIWLLRVYPRVCGGTTSRPISRPTEKGLSPRVRGNRTPRRRAPTLIGSIPACAGEPCPPVSRPSTSPVYPRVCGGTAFYSLSPGGRGGLSPRVRGNQVEGPVIGG